MLTPSPLVLETITGVEDAVARGLVTAGAVLLLPLAPTVVVLYKAPELVFEFTAPIKLLLTGTELAGIMLPVELEPSLPDSRFPGTPLSEAFLNQAGGFLNETGVVLLLTAALVGVLEGGYTALEKLLALVL